MGIVFQAIDEDGQYYAVKEMHDRFTNAEDREEGITRFEDEAKMLARLRGHPNIPHVYGFFIDEGRYYLAMEFIFGEDLEDVLKRQPRFSEPQVLQWADQLCDVLEYLHQNGLIYRDMKPSNVMIARDGTLKVVDFGIAKLLQPGQRGTMIGTPGYAPPEQYQGIATVQSDMYALAATLHHLLTGRDPREEPPFSFPPARDIRPEISQDTNDALEKALQMELSDRFKTLSEFRRALPIPTGERQRTRIFDPVPRAEPPARPQQQRPQQQARPQQARPAPPPVRPVQTAPKPQSQVRPIQPAPKPRVQPQPRRRGGFGRAVRRVVATGLVAAGLGFGLVQFQPEIATAIERFITTTVQPYLQGQPQTVPGNTAPGNTAPNGVTLLQQYNTILEIDVPTDATDAVIQQQLRDAFLTKMQTEYPGATLSNAPLSNVGGQTRTDLGNGTMRVSVEMSTYINVPQP